jgi:hypothetical protein
MALIDNCVAYYKLDGNYNDATGTNNGDATSGVSYNASYGKIGQGMSVTAGYIGIPDNNSLDMSGNMTISCWAQYRGGSGYRTIISKRGTNWEMGINASHIPYWYDGANVRVASTALTIDTWYHIVGVVTSGNVQIYLNASADGSAQSVTMTPNTAKVYIGGVDATVGQPWYGYIDEIGIWSRALSTDEITSLYNSGNGFAYPFVTTNIKSIDGLAYASCKSVNGLAMASIKSINSLV